MRTFVVQIKNQILSKKFFKEFRSFAKLEIQKSTNCTLNIDFEGYGKLDVRQQRNFNTLRNKCFATIPEGSIRVEINRFNKRKWKRKHSEKISSHKVSKIQLETYKQIPPPNFRSADWRCGQIEFNRANQLIGNSSCYLPRFTQQFHCPTLTPSPRFVVPEQSICRQIPIPQFGSQVQTMTPSYTY